MHTEFLQAVQQIEQKIQQLATQPPSDQTPANGQNGKPTEILLKPALKRQLLAPYEADDDLYTELSQYWDGLYIKQKARLDEKARKADTADGKAQEEVAKPAPTEVPLTPALKEQLLAPYKGDPDLYVQLSRFLDILILKQTAGLINKPDPFATGTERVVEIVRQFLRGLEQAHEQTRTREPESMWKSVLNKWLTSYDELQASNAKLSISQASVDLKGGAEEYAKIQRPKALPPHAVQWAQQLLNVILVCEKESKHEERKAAEQALADVMKVIAYHYSIVAETMQSYGEMMNHYAHAAKSVFDAGNQVSVLGDQVSALKGQLKDAEGSVRTGMTMATVRQGTLKASRNMAHDNLSVGRSWSGLRYEFLDLLKIEIDIQQLQLRKIEGIVKNELVQQNLRDRPLPLNSSSSATATLMVSSAVAKTGAVLASKEEELKLQMAIAKDKRVVTQKTLLEKLYTLFFRAIDEEPIYHREQREGGSFNNSNNSSRLKEGVSGLVAEVESQHGNLELWEKVKALIRKLDEHVKLDNKYLSQSVNGTAEHVVETKPKSRITIYETDLLPGFDVNSSANKHDADKMYQKLSRLVKLAEGVEDGMLTLFFKHDHFLELITQWKKTCNRLNTTYSLGLDTFVIEMPKPKNIHDLK